MADDPGGGLGVVADAFVGTRSGETGVSKFVGLFPICMTDRRWQRLLREPDWTKRGVVGTAASGDLRERGSPTKVLYALETRHGNTRS